jgi:hypothetical protein
MVAGEGRRWWLPSLDRRPLPQPLLGGLCGNDRLVAFPFRPRAHRTLGHQLLLRCSERFLDLQLLCIGSLRHFVSCKTLMAELCLKVVDGVARINQQPLGFLARSGLLPQGLPGGVQLLKAGAAVTMNHCDGNVAVARKMTPLMMWPIGRVGRMRRMGHWRRFSI